MAKESWRQQREREQREALKKQREEERYAAQQQREAERARAREEREERAQYVASRQEEAEEMLAATEQRVRTLESILHTGLQRRHPLNFDRLRIHVADEPFEPGALDRAEPAPDWTQHAPHPPGALAKLLGGAKRHERRSAAARSEFDAAVTAHAARERSREAKLAKARRDHERELGERKRHATEHNAYIARLEQDFRNNGPEAVEDCLRLALESTELPDGVPNDVRVGYRAPSAQVLVIRELPDTDLIPTSASFRYVKSRDSIEPTSRKPAEIRRLYASTIAQLALIALRDVFTSTTPGQVDEVTVNCHLSTTDRATGNEVHPCLVTVSAGRDDFAELVLDKLDPQECLRHLNALMSPHPYDVEPVRPLFDPDMDRFRTIDAHDAASRLDSRTVLVEQSATEFEHLVRQLFEAMGMQSWVTQASRDDGVDAVAVNPDPIMGGLSVIQAKRYKKVVPAEAARALWGVMEDKKAGTGVLVTTSYFGKATHDFAQRNERIRLIEGPELKHLLKEHLALDIILGSKQPPKRKTP